MASGVNGGWSRWRRRGRNSPERQELAGDAGHASARRSLQDSVDGRRNLSSSGLGETEIGEWGRERVRREDKVGPAATRVIHRTRRKQDTRSPACITVFSFTFRMVTSHVSDAHFSLCYLSPLLGGAWTSQAYFSAYSSFSSSLSTS
jgi:hypothetical protein